MFGLIGSFIYQLLVIVAIAAVVVVGLVLVVKFLFSDNTTEPVQVQRIWRSIRLSSPTPPESAEWLHHIVQRLFLCWTTQNGANLPELLTTVVQQTLQGMQIDAPTTFHRFAPGSTLPAISDIHTEVHGPDMRTEFNIDYSGDLEVSLSTKIPVDVPVQGFMRLPVSLKVSSLKFSGRMAVVWNAAIIGAMDDVDERDADSSEAILSPDPTRATAAHHHPNAPAGRNLHTFTISFVEPPSFDMYLDTELGAKMKIHNNKKITSLVRYAIVKGLSQITAPKFIKTHVDLTNIFDLAKMARGVVGPAFVGVPRTPAPNVSARARGNVDRPMSSRASVSSTSRISTMNRQADLYRGLSGGLPMGVVGTPATSTAGLHHRTPVVAAASTSGEGAE